MVCYYMAVEDNHMSKEITEYDVELGKRLEKIRKQTIDEEREKIEWP